VDDGLGRPTVPVTGNRVVGDAGLIGPGGMVIDRLHTVRCQGDIVDTCVLSALMPIET